MQKRTPRGVRFYYVGRRLAPAEIGGITVGEGLAPPVF